jgi:hypothetical protein
MYQYKGERTVSIPQFLKQRDEWFVEDETEAMIELAVCVSETTHPSYWIWQDLRTEYPRPEWVRAYNEALKELKDWANRIIG